MTDGYTPTKAPETKKMLSENSQLGLSGAFGPAGSCAAVKACESVRRPSRVRQKCGDVALAANVGGCVCVCLAYWRWKRTAVRLLV